MRMWARAGAQVASSQVYGGYWAIRATCAPFLGGRKLLMFRDAVGG